MDRMTLNSAQLYAILDREFKRLRPDACRSCRIPLPFNRKPPDDVSANWSIGTPKECPERCHIVIAELVTRLWTRYDLEAERPQ